MFKLHSILFYALLFASVVLVNKFIWDQTQPVQSMLYPACTHEDGSASPIPCYWNAKTQGNGQGSSHIVKIAP